MRSKKVTSGIEISGLDESNQRVPDWPKTTEAAI